ncbi:hypothetical protein [Streptomyces sp. NBC_01198]|uniref:hypothetical protein n=1 Tax=Streptomyces sp. NBC_01198 TaxID=2903769 RepID=UPI002E15733D|nr:hypothetical protein OG702_14830 [Streptomyces sp. NBC_01198]
MAITDAPRIRRSSDTLDSRPADGTMDGAVHQGAVQGSGDVHGDGDTPRFTPIPVWFFAFEGLIGASYDVVKTSPHAWVFLAASAAVNIVLARTVLRGRLKMAKAILKGKRTRKLAVGLIALRAGVHIALGAVGMQATSGPAHLALAAVMCAATVALLAFDQRVMLRALAAA